MATVMIDAGHGGTTDPGAVFEGRQEKDDNLRLALAVGKILEENGVNVLYTRTEDVYQRPIEKAQIANASGADFFISFHRNSSPQPNQYSGVETLVYRDTGDKAQMAEAINQNLEQVGFKNLGVNERPDLIVLRRTRMPAVLVETGFINTDADNQLFDERFDEIAQAIADGILSVVGEPNKGEKLYRVQTGAFRRQEYAQDQLYQLEKEGYPAYILLEDGYYKVQVGAFRSLENATRMEAALRRKGYATFITT
jgi:N-acetylmuramoyl-L-alanine amidase